MRFRRWHRPEPYLDTSRKRAAFHRKQRLEREALPLFADQIAAGQHGVEEEIAHRAVWWDELERDRRRECAAWWRRGRAALLLPRRAAPDDPKSLADLSLFDGPGELCRFPASDRGRSARLAPAVLDFPCGDAVADHTRPVELRRGVPPDRPPQDRRRPEGHGSRRVPVLRQSRRGHSLPTLARPPDRAP